MNTNVAGVVLAAGLSRRMGQPKALIKLGQLTFLEHMCLALSSGGCGPVVAIVNKDIYNTCQTLGLEQVKLIINPDPDQGQISSLRLALAHTEQSQAVVFTTVDQAHIEARTVQAVRQVAVQDKIVIARHNKQAGHPTAFGRSFFKALCSAQADTGARNLISEHANDVLWVDLVDPGIVRNINTPSDLQRELHRGCHRLA